jgi:signal transduction histidine kinase
MGLSISRSIIENHAGRLWLTEHEGSGASFCFTLPSHPPKVNRMFSHERSDKL